VVSPFIVLELRPNTYFFVRLPPFSMWFRRPPCRTLILKGASQTRPASHRVFCLSFRPPLHSSLVPVSPGISARVPTPFPCMPLQPLVGRNPWFPPIFVPPLADGRFFFFLQFKIWNCLKLSTLGFCHAVFLLLLHLALSFLFPEPDSYGSAPLFSLVEPHLGVGVFGFLRKFVRHCGESSPSPHLILRSQAGQMPLLFSS